MKKMLLICMVLMAGFLSITCSGTDSGIGNWIIPDNDDSDNNDPGKISGDPWTQVTYTATDVAALNNIRVFIAHNSVGNYTFDYLVNNNPFGLAIARDNLDPLSNGMNAFWINGCRYLLGIGADLNGNPEGKLNAFRTLLASKNAGNAHIAFLKFCYVDILASTDVNALFNTYVATLNDLQNTYRNVTFVHCTAPLESHQYPGTANDNAKRHAYNELLRQKYGEMLFDLAAIEAVDSSGNQVFSSGGACPAMAPEWTSDGGHPNNAGCNRVASALISFLAQVPLK